MNKILFLGDFFYNYEFITNDIENISKFIKDNNYCCILNLEGSLVKSKNVIKKRGPNLYHSEITIDILKKLNVIGVTLSNNHVMDFGEEALSETIYLLNKANIKYCGAGLNLDEALKPMVFSFNDKRIVIFNYGWDVEETVYASKNKAGCSPKDLNYLYNIPKKYSDDYIIKILHWGFEYNIYPMPMDIDIAHNMINSNTDLIIGHHPHVIQSKEVYCGKNIYYSLGNFYFSGRRKRFLRKQFNGKFIDKCSYGLGVVFDPISETIDKELLFYYDNDIDETIIIDKYIDKEILSDITNINFKSKEYLSLLRDTKRNGNPILTNNCFCNMIKLILLRIKYFFKDYLIKILIYFRIKKR